MAEAKNFILSIDKLAGLGDGAGTYENRKVYVPYTASGDTVKVRMVRRTTDADYAVLEEVVTPAASRIAPVCRHYTQCGGCSLQHINPQEYKAFKLGMAQAAVRKAGYDVACVQELVTFLASSRRRAELKVKDGRLGYFAAASHALTQISECKVLEPQLEALVMQLKPHVASWQGGESIQLNGLDNGYDMLLTGGTAPAWKFETFAGLKRTAYRNSEGKAVILYDTAEAQITLGGVVMTPPPGAFLQAVRGAQDTITSLVLQGVGTAKHVLDLFCGLGTYSFPLSNQCSVTAVEGDAAMVAALAEAAAREGRAAKVVAKRRDLFRDPFKAAALERFDAVVINPPRAGAMEQSRQLAQSSVASIIMVSCNPATFARDARLLKDGGYRLANVTPIDQFTYSPHLEIIAEFVK